jgi:hypothetical protein
MADVDMTDMLEEDPMGDDDRIEIGILGVAVPAGHPVYLDHATQRYFPVDTNLAGHAADHFGRTLDGGDVGDEVRVQTSGSMQPVDNPPPQPAQEMDVQEMPAPEVPGEPE